MYNNYDHFLSKVDVAREWVAQFTRQNLAQYFVAMIKPKKIELGLKNTISKEGIVTTTSEALHKKYHEIMSVEQEYETQSTVSK
jgi:hypothetical protein